MRDFTYVSDVVDVLLLAAEKKEADGQIFNVGGLEIINLKELAKLLLKIYGHGSIKIQKFPKEQKKIDVGDYYSDFSAIQRVLGWKPQIALRKGLRLTLEYYSKYLKHYI